MPSIVSLFPSFDMSKVLLTKSRMRFSSHSHSDAYHIRALTMVSNNKFCAENLSASIKLPVVWFAVTFTS